MPVKGYLTIRNIPMTSENSESGSDFGILFAFFQKNKLCPGCDGIGFHPGEIDQTIESTVLKYRGIKDLELLSDNCDVKMCDVIREILETKLCGREPCKTCSGSRFVERKTSHGKKEKNKKSLKKITGQTPLRKR